MTEALIGSLCLDLNREFNGRRPTDHLLLQPGTYRLDQTDPAGAYNPYSPSSQGKSAHWFHEVHVGIVPISDPHQECESSERMQHLVIRNPRRPGPHPDGETARDAFREIDEAHRTIEITSPSSVVFWIQAGEYGDWEKGRWAYGTMRLQVREVAT